MTSEGNAPGRWSRAVGLAVAAAVLVPGVWVKRRTLRSTPHMSGHLDRTPAPGLPFRLEESSAATGLANVHAARRGAESPVGDMTRQGASVAVADVDGDGWPDVYLTNSAPGALNRLFRNNRDGTFSDIAGSLGLADVNRPMESLRAVFFDMDNDGRQDLFLNKADSPRVLLNRGRRFEDVTGRSSFARGYGWASNVLDIDGDGYLDIVSSHLPPSNAAFHILATAESARGAVAAYRNDGKGGFRPFAADPGLRNDRGYVHAVGVYDLQGDGRADLYLARDWAADLVYYNEGGGRFSDGSGAVRQKYSLNGMSAEIAELDNDGTPSVYVTNLHEPGIKNNGNILWKAVSSGRFRDVAASRGVRNCGFAWGAKFLDLDNDGLLDLVVANGFVTGADGRDGFFRYLTMSQAAREIAADGRNWPKLGDRSWSGRQQDCVFWNRGGVFRDVSGAAGIDGEALDGRAVAAIDHMNDGRLSLVVTNDAQPVRFYRNVAGHDNGWIGFRLVATRGARDAFGARVSVRLRSGALLTRELQPANGYLSQSDARLHFGLGPEPAVESVTVRWPGRAAQTLAGPPAPGRYHTVVEP